MKTLLCKTVLKFSEEDHFEHGCIGDTIYNSYDYEISGQTLHAIKREISGHLGCDDCDLIINPCEDEPNRIDAQLLENKEGIKASKHQIDLWKKQKIRLWLCCYTFYFDLVSDETVNLLEY